MRFLIANPAGREAAGKTAKKRIEERHQWRKIARDIEKMYLQLMGWELPSSPRKTFAGAATVGAGVDTRGRAG